MSATRPLRSAPPTDTQPAGSPEEMVSSHRLRSAMLVGLFLLALFFTFHLARTFFLPVALAVLFNLLLSPVVRFMGRAGLSPGLAAGILLLALLGVVGFGIYQLAVPAREWMANAPSNISRVRERLSRVTRPVEQIKQSAEKVQQEATGAPQTAAQPSVTVKEGSSMLGRVFGTTQVFLIGLFETVVLLLFLLASGPLFLEKTVKVLPRLRDKKKAVEIATKVEGAVSRYLFTVTAINIGEG